jgi:HMG-box domain
MQRAPFSDDSREPDCRDFLPLETAMTSGFLIAKHDLKTEPGTRSMDASELKVSASKPTKNLSAYNFYFKDQRRKMLEKLPIRPEGKPRRSHGKIGFSEMAKTIGAGWKSIDAETRRYYEYLAKQDKERYIREMEEWKGKQKVLGQEKLSSYLHSKADAEASSRYMGGEGEVALRPDACGSAPGDFTVASIGSPVATGTFDSLHSNAQLLHASLQTRSQNAIEQMARPLRAAASLPSMQQFTSPTSSPLDSLPATFSLPSFRAHQTTETTTSYQVLTPNAMSSLSSWSSFEDTPGGRTLLRQPESTHVTLSRQMVQRHPPPHPFPSPGQKAHNSPYPVASQFHVLNPTTRGISILANELDSEGVEFFLDLFREQSRHS